MYLGYSSRTSKEIIAQHYNVEEATRISESVYNNIKINRACPKTTLTIVSNSITK